MNKLLSCPFCGSYDVEINSEDVEMEYREGYWGECIDCGARGGFAGNESADGMKYAIEGAIDKWNTRTYPRHKYFPEAEVKDE